MKRKISFAVIILMLSLLLFGLTACGEKEAPGENESASISFKTLTVNGNNVYGKVSNDTTYYSFIDEISTVGGADYIVSRNVTGTDWLPAKTIDLAEGDNTVYIIEMVNDEPASIYTVVIRRTPVYTVTFDANGGSSVKTQYIEEECFATVPEATTYAGYTFIGWDYDFSAPITSDTNITASWEANTDTEYTVEYYLENLDKSDYELVDTDELTGTTDTTATAEQKIFEHFTFNSAKSVTSGNISGNGSLVLKLYYTRDTYEIKAECTNTKAGAVSGSATFTYENAVTLTATTNAGYTFLGWFEGENKVYDGLSYTFNAERDVTYEARWKANTDTKYTVEYYLENLDKSDYELVDTDELTGTTDTTATAEQKIFEHFTFNSAKSVVSGNINGDGSLVLKLYYTRNQYTLSNANTNYGSITNSGTYDYSETVTTTATVELLGYEFTGWYSDGKLISKDATYTFAVDKNLEARFAPVEGLNDFYFTSTATACEITGIKNENATAIVIPDFVTAIGNYAFYYCTSLTSVTIGNSVTSIGDRAFSYCISLASVTIPNSVTSIGNYAFYGCSSLASVTIPNSVTSIGDRAFSGCYKLVEVINLSSLNITAGSDSYGYVGYYAIEVHTGESKIVNYNDYLFYTYNGVNYLLGYVGSDTSIVLPENYNGEAYEIYDYAFRDCKSLTSVTIPNSVTSIGSKAFYGCYKLVEVINLSSLNITAGSSGNGYISRYAKEVHKDESKIVNYNDYLFYTYNGVNYLIAYVGNNTELVLLENYNGEAYKIYEYAFYDCISLTSVVIGNSVTSIGNYAFSGCSSLTSVTIPDSVTSIGSYAFYNCTSLTSVTIPDSVTSIGYDAFYGCTSLASVVIGNSVTSIGGMAFSDCISLASVVIGNSVTSIGEMAFSDCISLASVTIPDSVTSIGDYAFYNCTSLASIYVDESNSYYKSIDGNLYTKDGKTLLQYTIGKSATSFTVPDSVTSICNYAFRNCTSLKSVTISDSVTSIGKSAFRDCTSLISVVIGNSVTSIDSEAFYGCTNLASVAIPNSVKLIGSNAFEHCESLMSVVIPDSVTSIAFYAFRNCTSLTIYCEAASKPSGWDSSWNPSNRPVVWGYKAEE